MRPTTRFLLTATCLATAFCSSSAAAQETSPDQGAMAMEAPPEDDARTLFQRGQAAYAQGDYDAAITAWTRAYELDPRPLLQFNLSQALERLGRLEDAVTALGLYLDRADPQDVHQADARARQASLRERISRTSVTLSGAPEGATILVDAEDRGRTPHPDPIVVTPGSHTVVLELEGYESFTSSIVVPAGQSVAIAVAMRASQRGPVASAQESGPDLLIPGILWGVGGAAVVAGAVIGGVALGEAQSAPGRESPEADSARGLALGADITMGIGAACLVAGVVVLIVELTSGGGDESADVASAFSIVPAGSAQSGGVVAMGSF